MPFYLGAKVPAEVVVTKGVNVIELSKRIVVHNLNP